MIIRTHIKVTILHDTETKLSTVESITTDEQNVSDQYSEAIVVTKPKEKKAKIAKKNEALEDPNPYIILEDNKLVFNKAAVDFMELEPGVSNIKIKYESNEKGIYYPIIAKIETFGVKSGNKLAKNLSVIYKGKNSEVLKTHGESFRLEKHPSGVFKMLSSIEKDIPVQIIIPKKGEAQILNDLDLTIDDSELLQSTEQLQENVNKIDKYLEDEELKLEIEEDEGGLPFGDPYPVDFNVEMDDDFFNY